MKNKKTAWGILIAIIILIVILIIWGWTRGMGPTETFLNLGNLFASIGGKPGKPTYSQYILDCSTGKWFDPGEMIEPGFGCDNWETNRFERPFNAIEQDEYYSDLDILYAYLGSDSDWFYLRFALFDPLPGSEFLAGTYALEMDLDGDGRGDLLVLVSEPGKEAGEKWSTSGVQIWADTDDDVGGRRPNSPDPASTANGYDTLIFDQGTGDDPEGAWARVFMSGSAYVELAFKTDYLNGDSAFKWWVWAGYAGYSPDLFELHDFYSHEQAGDANKGMGYFPIKEVFAMDSSCANMWGDAPNPDDPEMCINEKSVFSEECPPIMDTSIINPIPCQPGDDGPGSDKTPTYTSDFTPTFTLVSTPTFTLVPTDTPTLTPTPTTVWVPTPTKVCKPGMLKAQCLASGGTWVDNAGKPSFCQCP